MGARVEADRGEKTTAFGFPTIQMTDPETKIQIRAKAGCPGDQATGSSGNPLTHTSQIENEQLIGKGNPLQMSLKSYTQELRQSTNAVSKGNDPKSGKIRPNDFNRISADLQKT